jgi:hypothetical protein
MGLPARLKSKKVALGVGAVVVTLVGFLVLKSMTSEVTEVAPEQTRSARPAAKKVSKPQKKESGNAPLFEGLQNLKDPFRTEDPKVVELQDQINTTKKEIEFLKASLEEKKLRQEIKELEKSIKGTADISPPEGERGILSTGRERAEIKSQKSVLVKAILIEDDQRSAFIVSGGQKAWVHEGEEFDGWEIKEIKKDRVVVLRTGKIHVFFYDRPSSVTIEG